MYAKEYFEAKQTTEAVKLTETKHIVNDINVKNGSHHEILYITKGSDIS